MADELLDIGLLSRLERLSMLTHKLFRGSLKGEKRSKKLGTSIEFADYREYAPGDDFRRIDWCLYGRLDKLFVKLYVEEEDLNVYLLIDRSESMAFGEPSKFLYARRLAAALAYIGLCNLDRVGLMAFSSALDDSFGPVRGKPSVFRVFEYLKRLETGGQTRLSACMKSVALRVKRPGLLIVISDFLDRESYRGGLTALLGRGFDIGVIQVLDRTELEPDLVGDLKLVDSETQEEREVTIGSGLLRRYRGAVEDYCGRLRSWCLGHGATYALASTATPIEELVLHALRRHRFLAAT